MNEPGRRARPPGRYGESHPTRRVALVVAVGAVAVAFLGWLGWAALRAAHPQTRSEVISFRVLDDSRVRVRFQVVAAKGSAVVCSVQALDGSRTTVGISDVTVPAGAHDERAAETVVRTRDRAVTATVAGCRIAPD